MPGRRQANDPRRLRNTVHRRSFCLSLGSMLTGIGSTALAAPAPDFQSRCQTLEAELGGRLGVACLDIQTGDRLGYRADERFPFCSTFKWLAAAAVLAQVDAGRERLDRRIPFSRADLLEWSPVTGRHADGDGMALGALCEAAITESDNTAANLLLSALGGLEGGNHYLRAIGDTTTRLDRHEPELNEARPGDVRDTTTPAAMADDLQHVLLGDALSPASRAQLVDWMLATRTSDGRLRAGMPTGWRLADKTGSGNSGTGTAGDVGVYWPPDGAPIVVAVYLTQARVAPAAQEAAIATVGRWVRERG